MRNKAHEKHVYAVERSKVRDESYKAQNAPKYFVSFLGLLVSVTHFALGCTEITTAMCVVMVIAISAVQLFLSQGNKLQFLLFALLSYANYSILIYFYIAPPEINYYAVYQGTYYARLSIGIVILFLATLTFFIIPGRLRELSLQEVFVREENHNAFILAVIFVILLYILINGYKPPDALGERGSTSTLYESATVFLLVGYYFAGKSMVARRTLLCFAVLLAIEGLVFGDRIAPIQFLLGYFVVYHLERTSFRTLIVFCVIGILLLGFIGETRGPHESSALGFVETWLDRKGAQSTFPAAYHASITFVVYENVTSTAQQIELFLNFVTAQFIGTKNVPDGNLAVVTRAFYWHNYGGIFPFFFYFYFGLVGVMVFSALPGIFVRLLGEGGVLHPVISVACLYFVITVFRWYVYSPTGLMRSMAQLLLIFGAAYLFHRFFVKARLTRRRKVVAKENDNA